ncbi:MAG: hypothetical protein JXA14_24635 [Anaerolineae bacterium]|nr:hypothetical protein [Anaerolineae bacterium]
MDAKYTNERAREARRWLLSSEQELWLDVLGIDRPALVRWVLRLPPLEIGE